MSTRSNGDGADGAASTSPTSLDGSNNDSPWASSERNDHDNLARPFMILPTSSTKSALSPAPISESERKVRILHHYTSPHTARKLDHKYDRFQQLQCLSAVKPVRSSTYYKPLSKEPFQEYSLDQDFPIPKSYQKNDVIRHKLKSSTKSDTDGSFMLLFLVCLNALLSVTAFVLLCFAIHGATDNTTSGLKKYGWTSGTALTNDNTEYHLYGGALHFFYETDSVTSGVFSYDDCSIDNKNLTMATEVTIMCRECSGVGFPVSVLVSVCLILAGFSLGQDAWLAWTVLSRVGPTKTAPSYVLSVSLAKVVAILFGSLVWPMNLGCQSSLGDTVHYGTGSVLFYFVWILEASSLIILGIIRKCCFRSAKVLPDVAAVLAY